VGAGRCVARRSVPRRARARFHSRSRRAKPSAVPTKDFPSSIDHLLPKRWARLAFKTCGWRVALSRRGSTTGSLDITPDEHDAGNGCIALGAKAPARTTPAHTVGCARLRVLRKALLAAGSTPFQRFSASTPPLPPDTSGAFHLARDARARQAAYLLWRLSACSACRVIAA
jgi:hypothetical protein